MTNDAMPPPGSDAELSPADRDVIAHGRRVVAAVCEELHPMLLAATGVAGATAKPDGSPVTDADHLADATIVRALTDAFSDHEVISEEGETTWEGGHWTWVVDPIDGTSNFTAGIPYWCTAIALLRDGVPVYGCIDSPILGIRFEGERGRGATRNGEPLRVRERFDYTSGSTAYVPAVVTAGTIRRATGGVLLNARMLGSAALDLAHVASGALAVAYQAIPKVWDIAAGSLMIEEAGGAYISLDQPILPLRTGVDLAVTTSRALAGPERDWLLELHQNL